MYYQVLLTILSTMYYQVLLTILSTMYYQVLLTIITINNTIDHVLSSKQYYSYSYIHVISNIFFVSDRFQFYEK